LPPAQLGNIFGFVGSPFAAMACSPISQAHYEESAVVLLSRPPADHVAFGFPEHLRRSLTWDQGAEMAQHARLKIDAGVKVYFCDPHSPWQRCTNENTNGLLRQYFPKGTDLSMHSADEIAAVTAALNSRPRKTLDWKTPAESLDRLLLSAEKDRVATNV
jgi:hypothetical protein